MKSLLTKRLTWVKIVESILLILLGILVAVLGGLYHEQFPQALTICLSIFLLIDGIITLFEFWLEAKKNFTFSSVLGALFITTGVGLALYAAKGQDLGQDIAIFISILLVTFGGIFLIKAIIQCVYKGPVGWIIVHYLIAAGGIALGTCALIYSKEDALKIVLIVLGCAIAILGSVDLIFAIIKYRRDKAAIEENDSVSVNVELDGNTVVMKGKAKNKKAKKNNKKDEEQIDSNEEIKQLDHESDLLKENNETEATENHDEENHNDDDDHHEETVDSEVIDPKEE